MNKLFKNQCYIDGQWVGDPVTAVYDPATAAEIARVPDFGAAETKQAIEAAQRAFGPWSKKLAKERAAILRRWFDLIIAHTDELAQILTREQGKPLAEAKGEIAYGASFVEFFAEEAKRIYGDVIPTHRADGRLLALKQPVGVVAAITPWNFPMGMITRKIAPALAAGCTVVCKPAEDTPLSGFALMVLAEQAGFPAGVINMVTTSRPESVGNEMCANPIVRSLTFTGSTAVGRLLMRQCADTVKKVSLELGGNAPFIVFDDADLDAAVAGAIASKYRNAGQTCVCANRIYVQDKIYDAFAEKFAAAAQKLKLGNGFDDGVTLGPLINRPAFEKVQAHVADALAKGAKLLCGGAQPENLGGTFYAPTVLRDVTSAMRITREETFGPVAPLIKFSTEEEAIALANDTEFGLAGYFYSRDVGRCWRMAEALECGVVGVNAGVVAAETTPFGGMKQSGLGREGSHYGMDEFTEIKYVMMGV